MKERLWRNASHWPWILFWQSCRSDRWNGVGFREVDLAKEIEPVHVFHFRTSKFDYEGHFTGPEMLKWIKLLHLQLNCKKRQWSDKGGLPLPQKKNLSLALLRLREDLPIEIDFDTSYFWGEKKNKKLAKVPQGSRNNNKYFGQDFNFRFSRVADVWLRF